MRVSSETKYYCDRCGSEVKPASEFLIFKTGPVFITVKKHEAYLVSENIEKLFDDARKSFDEEVLMIELTGAYQTRTKEYHLCGNCARAFYKFFEKG